MESTRAAVAARHRLTVLGAEQNRPMLLAHGFGCDQSMWRHVAPHFARTHRVFLFDHAGMGGSDPAGYDPQRHAVLQGYARDVIDICSAFELSDVVFVGHSVSAMIGVLAAKAAPEYFGALVLVGPSPRYLDDVDYVGGFSDEDIADLLDSLDSNYLGWAAAMAPAIMGRPDRPELGAELTELFCRTDPEMARHFARVTFLSDNRADLADVTVPALVLQSSEDAIAPVEVGRYVAEHLPRATLQMLEARGHCPNLSAPDETIAAIERFLDQSVSSSA